MPTKFSSFFVPYTESADLKKLVGFDDECEYFYTHLWNDPTKIQLWSTIEWDTCGHTERYHLTYIYAPLFQQAFKWFREKHKLEFEINSDIMGYVGYIVDRNIPIKRGLKPTNLFQNYEEAEIACLIELIEIVKKKEANE